MTEFYRDEKLVVLEGDCRAVLRSLPGDSVHCVVTSPPYYSLRDYGIEPTVWGGEPEHEHAFGGQLCACGAWLGQLGLEPHPDLFVEHLVEVFREVRRVLHPEGTVWLNLGDSYAAERGGTEMPAETMAGGVGGQGDERAKRGRPAAGEDRLARHDGLPHRQASRIGLKHKDLILVPFLTALALRTDGWWLRRDVIWSKPSPMPESAEDRPASSHEYVWMLTKSERYFYDRIAVLEPSVAGHSSGNGFKRDARISGNLANGREDEWVPGGGRNLRSVWTIATRPYKGAHFATFPPKLVEPPIKASTSSVGACPECGAQWRRRTVSEFYGDWRDRSGSALHLVGLAQDVGLQGDGFYAGYQGPQTIDWRPGCGHGWGGEPDDLDLIASPLRGGDRLPQPQEHMPADGQRPSGQRGNRTSDIESTTRRGLDRARQAGEGRRIITRYEQRAYAAQLRSWTHERIAGALDEIARWLDKAQDVLAWRSTARAEQRVMVDHPGWDAWAHYLRFDRRGARAIPPKLFDRWIEAGWLTPVEPPDFSGALTPVPAVVLDPFGGSGTVGMVAAALGRHAILIDVNGEYLVQQLERNRQIGLGLGL